MCCRKSEYFTKSGEIGATEEFLEKKYHGVKFTVGEDVLQDNIMEGWTFETEGSSKIPNYLKNLHETGILCRLGKEEQRRPFVTLGKIMPRKDTVEKIGMSGNIVTLYVFLSILFSAAAVCFSVEIRKVLKNFMKYLAQEVVRRVRNCTSRLG